MGGKKWGLLVILFFTAHLFAGNAFIGWL